MPTQHDKSLGATLYSWQKPVSNGGGWFWEEASEVVIPPGAVKTSDRMYVVRSAAGDVGKFICNEGTAKFPAYGKERTLGDFEFLVLADGAEAVWLLGPPSLDDCVWASERMAVIRATDHPDRDPGKFVADENAAKIPRDGKEVTLPPDEYELLTVRRTGPPRSTSPPPAYGGSSHTGAGAAGSMGAASAAAHALAERGERLSSLEGATQQMALQAESLASMATQLNEREQSRSMFPWS